MYVYICSAPGLYTAGYHDPAGKWCPESDHPSASGAAGRVAWLNGGAHLIEQLSQDLAEHQEWTRSELERLEDQLADREREIEALQECPWPMPRCGAPSRDCHPQRLTLSTSSRSSFWAAASSGPTSSPPAPVLRMEPSAPPRGRSRP